MKENTFNQVPSNDGKPKKSEKESDNFSEEIKLIKAFNDYLNEIKSISFMIPTFSAQEIVDYLKENKILTFAEYHNNYYKDPNIKLSESEYNDKRLQTAISQIEVFINHLNDNKYMENLIHGDDGKKSDEEAKRDLKEMLQKALQIQVIKDID